MGLLDGPLRNVANSLISQMGKTITLVEKSTGQFQPSNDTAPLTLVRRNVQAILGEVNANNARGNVKAGDRIFEVAASALPDDHVPDTDWQLILDDTLYIVVEVTTLYANEEPVTYKIYARLAP